MTYLLKILILTSTLTATSYALSCTKCTSVFSSTCSGDKVTCPFGSFCGSIYTEIIVGEFLHKFLGGLKLTYLNRDCIASTDCNVKDSMSLQYGEVKSVTSCCDTDNCTPTINEFSTESSKPNGLVCEIPAPSGLSNLFSNINTIQCRGDESACIQQKTKITGGSTSIWIDHWACGTRTLCDISDQFNFSDGISFEYQFICSKEKVEL